MATFMMNALVAKKFSKKEFKESRKNQVAQKMGYLYVLNGIRTHLIADDYPDLDLVNRSYEEYLEYQLNHLKQMEEQEEKKFEIALDLWDIAHKKGLKYKALCYSSEMAKSARKANKIHRGIQRLEWLIYSTQKPFWDEEDYL